MLFALVAACGDDAADDPGGYAGDLSGTVTVWCWDPNFNLFAMEEAAKIYKQINPDFEIVIVEMPGGEIEQTIITAATSGDLSILPDIFLNQNMSFQKTVKAFPEVFTDLTNSGIDFSQFGDGNLGFISSGGRKFGVPFDAGTTILALREDIIGEAGFTIDDFTDITWGTFITQGKAVLEATGMPLISTIQGGGDYVAFMLQSAGTSFFDANGQPTIIGNPAIIETVNIYNELVASGVLLEVPGWGEYIDSFVNGNVAGTISGCWILGSIQQAEDQSGLWRLTSIPRLDVPGGTNYSSWGGSSWVVSADSKVQALAIDFLKHTFAGSVEFYENILEAAGALAVWKPAGASPIYQKPQEFFGGQAIFADIVRFTGNVPAVSIGEFFYEARDTITDVIINVRGGADINAELEAADAHVRFLMG